MEFSPGRRWRTTPSRGDAGYAALAFAILLLPLFTGLNHQSSVQTHPTAGLSHMTTGQDKLTSLANPIQGLPSDFGLLATVPVGSAPVSSAYDPNNGYVYVPCVGTDNVSVVRGTAVVATIPTGEGPLAAAFDPQDGLIYVSERDAGMVAVINSTVIQTTIPVGSGPAFWAYDNATGALYLSNLDSNVVSVIQGTTVTAVVPVVTEPAPILYDPVNGFIYVSSTNSSSISIINGTSVIKTATLGNYPEFPAVNPNNGYVYVPIGGESTTQQGFVTIIDNLTIVATLPVGLDPQAAAYNPANGDVYISNAGSSNVSIIQGVSPIGAVWVGGNPGLVIAGGGLVCVTGESSIALVLGRSLVSTIASDSYPIYGTYASNGIFYVSNLFGTTVSVVGRAQEKFDLTFEASGLPQNATWWVNLSEQQPSEQLGQSVVFALPNGTYTYTVSSADKRWAPESPRGSITIAGSASAEEVTFTPVTYSITFVEFGLPLNLNWSVDVDRQNISRPSGEPILVSLQNGSYAYAIPSTVTKWTPLIPTGELVVSGSPWTVNVSFADDRYSVMFMERGLPDFTEWWVNLTDLVSLNSREPEITVNLQNGTYMFAASSGNKSYAASASSLAVDGLSASVLVQFTLVTYPVTFSEVNLPGGTLWWVDLSGTGTTQSVNPELNVVIPNGSYTYSVGAANTTYAASGGALTVYGSPVLKAITFSLVVYTVVFAETGLAHGVLWSITLGSIRGDSVDQTITFSEPNGTYIYSVSAPAGYLALHAASGLITVDGDSVSVPIDFARTASAPPLTVLDLPPVTFALVVGGATASIIGGIVLSRLGRKRSRPRLLQCEVQTRSRLLNPALNPTLEHLVGRYRCGRLPLEKESPGVILPPSTFRPIS